MIKLTKVAAFAEIIGALAIIISLIFVGAQIKGNTKATRAATANDIHSEISEWYLQVGNSAQSSTLMLKYVTNPDSLTMEEKYQGTLFIHSLVLKLQNSFYLSKQGMLDEHISNSVVSALKVTKNTPGFEFYWQQRKSMFMRDFQDYVDQLMSSDETVTGDIYK